MQSTNNYQTEAVIVGGGLAGITTALELLDKGRRVLLLDRGRLEIFGGLANRAFGGVMLVDTPLQRLNRIHDSADIALADWENFAEFDEADYWPRQWAGHYINRCVPEVYEWLGRYGVRFFPAVQWPEKGLFIPGNSVPRYHVLWGTAQHMTQCLIKALNNHQNSHKLTVNFAHRVETLEMDEGRVCGCRGVNEETGQPFSVSAEHVVLASGGITGNLDKVRQHWPGTWNPAPATMLNGSHPHNDGALHDEVATLGGQLTHLDKQWNYAAGVHHPRPQYAHHGLSLIPCRSAIWTDYSGRRIGPLPLMTGYDTRYLCEQVSRQPQPYTWQILNRRIALKELAVSGAEHNPSIQQRQLIPFLLEVLLGNHWLYKEMTRHCKDFVIAGNLDELAAGMNRLTGEEHVQPDVLGREIERYDSQITNGLHNDDQLRRIRQLRSWSGDRVRTCNFQPVLDPKAGPLLAIRLHLITRKTLGGMQTDLNSQVLDTLGHPIDGLFAVGEASGFGGGGSSGHRSLEGTCLSGCILTAKAAARAISSGIRVEKTYQPPRLVAGARS